MLSGDIFLCPWIFRLSLGCHGPRILLDNSGLSHVQTSLVQPHAASGTKCSCNQRKFSLNDAHEQMVQRVHQVQEYLLSLGAAGPLRRRQGRLGGVVASEAPSQTVPSASLAGDGSRRVRTSPSPLPSPLRGAGGGGSMLRRILSSQWGRGVATPLAPLQANTSS